jgi:hypothetical protein
MNEPHNASIDRLIENLPKEIVPPKSLWPRIANRLASSRHEPRPMAMAAGIAVAAAFLASLFTWGVLQRQSTPHAIQLVVARNSFDEPRDPKYILARDTMEKTFNERLAQLEPATRAKIEASLAVIRKAHEDIRKALAADPESPVLEQLWESTWHDEYDLYDHVVQATQPTMTRI